MVCKFFDKNSVTLYYVIIVQGNVIFMGKTVFAQLMSLVPDYEFGKIIDKYNGNFKAKKFTCQDQFRVMSFAQFTNRPSLLIS